jgi:hypothetical protein
VNKKKDKEKLPLLTQFRHLREYLTLAGINAAPNHALLILIAISFILDLALTIFFTIKLSQFDNIAFTVIFVVFMITFGYAIVFIICWFIFLVMIDYLKFKRKIALEEVLPEFLRLVSANHRAGYSLELSLWKANRPRFGILSKEINEVARSTYAMGDISGPLIKFANKYDSSMLRRVVSNLIEGIRTGADISSLLDDVATNIITIKNTRKELASEVENYMLFITLTVLVISPFMFGLSHKLIGIVQVVKNQLAGTMPSGSENPINMSIEANTTDVRGFFDLFVYLMIGTNSIISVLLMSLVKYGNVKQDLKKIPVYYIIGVMIYMLCKLLFAGFINFIE